MRLHRTPALDGIVQCDTPSVMCILTGALDGARDSSLCNSSPAAHHSISTTTTKPNTSSPFATWCLGPPYMMILDAAGNDPEGARDAPRWLPWLGFR